MTRNHLLAVMSSVVLASVAACSSGGTTPQADTQSPTGSGTPSPTATGTPSSTPTGTPSTVAPTTVAPTTTAPSTAPASVTRSVHVYLLRGESLVSVHRSVEVTGGAVATAAVTSLLAGPTSAERAAGISTTIPTGTKLRGISIANGTATVDLSKEYASGGGTLSMSMRLAQVVYTATQFATVQRVNFRLDGTPVTVFSGEGIVLDHPATRAQYYELLPPIWIDSPAIGETVTSPVQVVGLANVFEGQFRVDVVDASGRVLVSRPAWAAMGEFRQFTVSLPYTVAKAQAGRVVGWDASPKDGSRIDEFPVAVTLR